MGDVDVGYGIVIPEAELEFRFSRSGGPGGQNVNRRATKVEVVFDLSRSAALTESQRRRAKIALHTRLDSRGRLHVVMQEERTQAQNRARALENLREVLARAVRPPPPPRRPTKPSAGATERRLTEKKMRSRTKKSRARPSLQE